LKKGESERGVVADSGSWVTEKRRALAKQDAEKKRRVEQDAETLSKKIGKQQRPRHGWSGGSRQGA
jgi:hypothetical protein